MAAGNGSTVGASALTTAMLEGESLTELPIPAGHSPSSSRRDASHLARGWRVELVKASNREEWSDEYRRTDGHLRIVRRALASGRPLHLHALRQLLALAQEATVRHFGDSDMRDAMACLVDEPAQIERSASSQADDE